MKLPSTKPVTLRLPPYSRACITLIGCGGTGSHLASGLATLCLALRERDVTPELTFMDPDTVEERNIGRQLFTAADLGQNKAQVLAARMTTAYRLGVIGLARPIDIGNTLCQNNALNLVVGAVDNAPARAIIAKACEAAKGRLWWIDAGNENHSGQVALGNTVDKRQWRPALGMVGALPAPHRVYPDLVKKPKKAKRLSCAEATAAGEQGLMVNRMVAAWALSLLHDFLLGQLRYFACAFDLAQGGARSYGLDETTLKEI